MKSKKTAIVLATTVPETLATILRFQPRRLAENFQVSLITSPGEHFDDVCRNENLAVYPVPMERGINLLADVVSLVRMTALLARLRPSLVHSYTPKAGLVCMLAAWLCRVPVRVHTFTGLVFPTARGPLQRILIAVDRLICACATHIVPEGQGVANDLRRYRVTGKPLVVIGHGNIAGVDTDYFAPGAGDVARDAGQLQAALAIPPGAFVFCFVGRLNRDKGLDELVAAFAAMPSDAHLLLVGALDASAPVSDATRSALLAHPRIHCLGFQQDIRPALHASDVFILPSYREGFPNVVLQAGAMALPVIASDINGCNEVVEPGHNGWLVPARDATALAESMALAMRMDRVALTTLGANARRRVASRFEQHDHWERIDQFYQSLLADADVRIR